MKVSILVPIYNVEEHIVKCARSLFAQSYGDCEFIFVDDCSPDSSVQRLEQVVENEFYTLRSSIHIIRHARNRGVAEARNTAMECASGDFLLFVDSDDWCAPNMVAKLVRAQREDNADLVSADFYSVTAKKTTRNHTHWVGGREGSLRIVLAQSFALPNRVWSLLIRNSLIRRNGIRFNSGVNYGEDSLFLVQLLYYAREIAHVDKPIYYYRADSAGSYSNNLNRRSIRNYVRSQLLIYEFLKERDATLRYTSSLMMSRLNLRRWMSIHNGKRDWRSYPYRLYCYILNRAWTIRCWLNG